MLDGVHQDIPDAPPANQPVFMAPAPPASQTQAAPSGEASPAGTPAKPVGTEADKLRQIYQSVGAAENHNFGVGPPGTKPPDFTKLPSSPLPPPAAPAPGTTAAKPAARKPEATKTGEPRAVTRRQTG